MKLQGPHSSDGSASERVNNPARKKKKTSPYTPKWMKPGLSRFEPKNVNFIELCALRYPGKQWKDLTLKEQVQILKSELRAKSWLIDPHCQSMKIWDAVVALCLLFTAIVTPYEVSFIRKTGFGLFVVNMIVYSVFIVDMLLQFFLMIEIKRPGKYGTVLCRDARLLRLRYLKTWAAIDFISVLPFDISLFIYTELYSVRGSHATLQYVLVVNASGCCGSSS